MYISLIIRSHILIHKLLARDQVSTGPKYTTGSATAEPVSTRAAKGRYINIIVTLKVSCVFLSNKRNKVYMEDTSS